MPVFVPLRPITWGKLALIPHREPAARTQCAACRGGGEINGVYCRMCRGSGYLGPDRRGAASAQADAY